MTTIQTDQAARPDILEKLTYHKYERDDMTLDDCLEYLANRWKKIHGRPERALIMQITELLAAAPQQAVAASSEPVQGEYEAFKEWYEKEAPVEGEVSEIDMARHGWLAGRRHASTNQPVQASNSDPVDGDWYWVQKEDIDRVWKWYPAQRQRNHWNSAQFSGIPLHEVKVGAAISSPSVQAKALTDEQRGNLDLITKCDPSWLIASVERHTIFDTKLLALVFDLAKDQARALLASQPSVDPTKPNMHRLISRRADQEDWSHEGRMWIDGLPSDESIEDLKGAHGFVEYKLQYAITLDDSFKPTIANPSAQTDVAVVRDAAPEDEPQIRAALERLLNRHGNASYACGSNNNPETYEEISKRSSAARHELEEFVISLLHRKSAAPTAQHPDDIAVDRFAAAMKAKLAKKRGEGYGGWNDKGDCTQGFLTEQLIKHTEKGDPVDVGNFAMMLHQRGERLSKVKYHGQQRVVAGALFDLMGRLTTRETPITLSSRHEASPAVEAIREFAEARGLKIDDAIVADWQYHVGIDPAPTAQPQADEKTCDHIYIMKLIDGSNVATSPAKAVCMHCGYEPQADGVAVREVKS